MSNSVFVQILFGILCYFGLFILVSVKNGEFAFNLKRNYKHWDSLNWFGVWFFTFLYWIIFLPFTVILLIVWVFTAGRED